MISKIIRFFFPTVDSAEKMLEDFENGGKS